MSKRIVDVGVCEDCDTKIFEYLNVRSEIY
jgi:hypothetical protein